jgi:AbrB family looped-hinge helix DNA binding protein
LHVNVILSRELRFATDLDITLGSEVSYNDFVQLSSTVFLILDIHYSLHYSNFVRKYFVEGRIMQSVITSKFQTTIPKAVREDIGLSVKDALDWKVEKGKIIVSPSKRSFLKYRNVIKTGRGDIAADIETARNLRVEKHR